MCLCCFDSSKTNLPSEPRPWIDVIAWFPPHGDCCVDFKLIFLCCEDNFLFIEGFCQKINYIFFRLYINNSIFSKSLVVLCLPLISLDLLL